MKIETTLPEITSGMKTAMYVVLENWVSLADLKSRGVTYNEMRTLVEMGWFEEKIEENRFFYRRVIRCKCSICGNYWFEGMISFPADCTELGHSWDKDQEESW